MRRCGLAVLALAALGLAGCGGGDASDGYEVEVRPLPAGLRPGSPVRIAGVDVGKVREVEPEGPRGLVRFTVEPIGKPVFRDAEVHVRPRIFLEGEYFLDLLPGTPGAGPLPDGSRIRFVRSRALTPEQLRDPPARLRRFLERQRRYFERRSRDK
jgi:ABC-type transporter Mla subunit MlaD